MPILPFTIFQDKSQLLDYNFKKLRLFVRSDNDLNSYSNDYKSYCHYHPDIEFSYTVSGRQSMFINGNYVHISAGECIFINSQRMHYGFSKNQDNCIFHVAAIHPSLFYDSSDLIKDYISQRFSLSNVDYILLSPNIPWQKTIIDRVLDLIAEMNKEDPSPFQLMAKANTICADICNHIEPVTIDERKDRIHTEFFEMMKFITSNYQHRITIDDIAKAGLVSQSKCNRLFQKFINQSPNVYLTKYRLYKSTELLRGTDFPITDIALSCGFQTASYYTNVFKQEMNTTPLQYRKNLAKKITG